MEVRALQESDWEMLVEWWKNWAEWGHNPSKEMLPLNGTGGLMIEEDGKPIMAGFLYLTNSKLAWIEWIVSDPEHRSNGRAKALELLINSLEEVAKSTGVEVIFSVTKNNSLLNMHKKLGYQVDDKPSYEISKKI
jgi:N-acetylglutamate synthase-like GNAT family acetyltransferase